MINVAEILKDCPSGMELDCTMFDNVTFERVAHNGIWINYLNDKNYKYEIYLDNEGCLPVASLNLTTTKCVIFPKGKTTWEGFQRPFKDGDVVFYNDTIAIFKEWGDETLFRTYVVKYLCCDSFIDIKVPLFGKYVHKEIRFATEEEKQKLFDAIKEYGYCWDEKTKTLEKLPQFKDGDIVVDDSGAIFIYSKIHTRYKEQYADFYCGITSKFRHFVIKTSEDQYWGKMSSVRLATEDEKQNLFVAIKANGYKWNEKTKTLEKLPKFKAWNTIKNKNDKTIHTINYVYRDSYGLCDGHILYFKDQDNYELVPNKFDITTLKEFESRVLVRDYDNRMWIPTFWGKYLGNDSNCSYLTTNGCYKYCIPYEGNEHLSGTTNDCDEYYKTW